MYYLEREFDLIVFGATGFSGQFVVEELALSVKRKPIKWAIAGRDTNKLSQTLEIASLETGFDMRDVTKIVADVDDEQSLLNMCAKSRVLLNCVGPYRFYGQRVIRACIECATHHLDISGEPQFLETIHLLYNKCAQSKEIYIIGSCGWDSIPCDLGVQYLKKNFDGQLNSVETFLKFKPGVQGCKVNYGTWLSMISGFADFDKLKEVRKLLYSQILTKSAFKYKIELKRKSLPFWSDIANGWCIPWPGSDRSVVKRTQSYKYQYFGENPTQIQTYFTISSLVYVIPIFLMALLFAALTKFQFGQQLLIKYPKLFSFGYSDKKGPTRQQIRESSFEFIIVGNGWQKQSDSQTSDHNQKPNKTVIVSVSGEEAGYIATASCLVQSALTLLEECHQMPKPGVLTPGAAFDKTAIYDRLRKRQVIFQVIDR